MTRRNVWLAATSVVAMVAVALTLTRTISGRVQDQVWAIDQSDSPGKTYGGTLYIWDGHELEKQKGVQDHGAMAEDAGAGFNPFRRRRHRASGSTWAEKCRCSASRGPARTLSGRT